MTQLIYFLLFTAIAAANLFVSHRCLAYKNREGQMLGYALRWAALVSLSYMLSILTSNERLMSISSSVHFASIDGMLFCLMRFFFAISGEDDRSDIAFLAVRWFFCVWAVVDAAILLTNPLSGIAISYVPLEPAPAVARWTFDPHRLYDVHLLLCYLMICTGFSTVVTRTLRIPHLYRHYYLRIILSVLVVVALNAVYLLQVTRNHIDYSIFFYSIMGYSVYWNAFLVKEKVLLSQARQTILDHLSQPLFLFDWDNRLILANESARALMCDQGIASPSLTVTEFIRLWGVADQLPDLNQDRRFYWTAQSGARESYICDFQLLRGKKKQEVVGRFFIFTNNTLGVDPLTGFQTQQYFNLHSQELIPAGEGPVGLAVCDLNRLTLLNDTMGQEGGDSAIRLQAQAMKAVLPGNTVFIRLQDALLCALCRGLSHDEIKARLNQANKSLEEADGFPIRLKMDCAVSLVQAENVVLAAQEAVFILRTRKLLDSNSDRSSVIDSLHQLLIECDSETEFHVRRTREMGERLAFLLGLSDHERDQLSLLCLFHDIGKVGIPQEILNRSGKLTLAEQEIMWSHVGKGYRIAKATPELNIVAGPILHHHERWDGSGYPDGLKQDSIPLLSRIISVVDAYDAMVSDRPYRKGMTQDEACRELRRCAGTQFDPYIVDVFLRMITGSEGAEATPQDIPEESIDPLHEKTGLVNAVSCAKYLLGPDERILSVDGQFEKLTGYTAYDVAQTVLTQNDMIFEDDRELYWHMVAEQLQSHGIVYLEHRLRRKDGTGRYVYCTGLPYADPAKGEARTIIIVSDITDSVSVQMQVGIARNRAMMSLHRLEEANQRDPLTGLLNRSAFCRACERELARDGQRCLMLMLDVDDLKKYNDSHGHPQGDELLLTLAQSLSAAMGTEGLAGRMGGDEFCCLLPLAWDASLSQIRSRGDEILRQINAQISRLTMSPTVSAGAACSGPRAADFSSMYARADKALYIAKGRGKAQLWLDEESQL